MVSGSIKMEDKVIICIQCGKSFVFTASEQEHFMGRRFDKPKRCHTCRKNKYKVIDSQETGKHNDKKKHLKRR